MVLHPATTLRQGQSASSASTDVRATTVTDMMLRLWRGRAAWRIFCWSLFVTPACNRRALWARCTGCGPTHICWFGSCRHWFSAVICVFPTIKATFSSYQTVLINYRLAPSMSYPVIRGRPPRLQPAALDGSWSFLIPRSSSVGENSAAPSLQHSCCRLTQSVGGH